MLIDRVRVRPVLPGAPEPGRLRAALEAAPWSSGRLPSGAVLVIRRLADPLPGALGPGRTAGEWGRRFGDVVDVYLREAARPVTGPVPAGARAVAFADRAELLAALAADWLAAELASHWWWRAWRRGRADALDVVREAWLADPRYVPAALDLLASRATAVDFARRLPPASATTLAAAAAAAFGGHALQAPPAGEPPGGEPGQGGPQAGEPQGRGPLWRGSQQGGLLEGGLLGAGQLGDGQPGDGLLEGGQLGDGLLEAGQLGAGQPGDRLLEGGQLGDGLLGTGQPGAGQPGGGLLGSGRMGEGVTDAESLGEPPQTQPQRSGAAVDAPWAAVVPEANAAGLHPGQRLLLGVGLALRRIPAVATRPSFWLAVNTWLATGHRSTVPPAAPPATAEPAPSTGPLPSKQTRSVHDASPPAQHRAATVRAEEPKDPVAPEGIVQTRLGGLFYLVNMAQYLGLYGDFTTPATSGTALNIWDFVTLLGRRLLGRPLPADPVWDLLATLAGHPPGHDFTPPADWRMPEDWLTPFPHGQAGRWSAAGGRLRVDHPAGFPILDVRRTTERPADQLRREFPGQAHRGSLPPLPTRPLPRWVATVAAYVSARLSYVLGHPPVRAVETLLWHRAAVSVTHVHVDVALSLAELPIEIRVAGLDRDPGWVPAAGRTISFHFD
jgi:hypothetical protein